MQPGQSDDTLAPRADGIELAFPGSGPVWLPTEAAEGFARDLVAARSGATSTRRTGRGHDVLETTCGPLASGVAFSIRTATTTVASAVDGPGVSLMVDALVGDQRMAALRAPGPRGRRGDRRGPAW